VSRIKVLPKFLQDMTRRCMPKDAKARGLKHATLDDKQGPLGRNDDDEYDLEGAQIVDSEYTADDVRVLSKKRETGQRQAPRAFFASEAPKVEVDKSEGMAFRGRAARSAARASSFGEDDDGAAKPAKNAVATGRRPGLQQATSASEASGRGGRGGQGSDQRSRGGGGSASSGAGSDDDAASDGEAARGRRLRRQQRAPGSPRGGGSDDEDLDDVFLAKKRQRTQAMGEASSGLRRGGAPPGRREASPTGVRRPPGLTGVKAKRPAQLSFEMD